MVSVAPARVSGSLARGGGAGVVSRRPDHVRILVGDDAKQTKHVSDEFGLCWIHEGRHYKELSPVVPQHQQQLEAFRTRYWDFYGELQEYQGADASDGGAVAG